MSWLVEVTAVFLTSANMCALLVWGLMRGETRFGIVERSASSCMKCQSVVVVDPDGGDRRVANLCLELLQAGERVFERLDCVGHDD